ncbi:hypothetical protein L6164_031471 [Bauhinia variegata]|uniref:Uncharacterized protein n=1 Tax=Bauhinia variegata TaxID=167791 RepID=A0ACB9LGG3_BAUVA|nr:hypothetical protein L6164_031471 [Bauhinia variegata]
MHDLLQKMGRSIVCEESQNDVGNRSRLWSKEDIDQVLRTNKGTRLIQAIVQESSEQYEVYSNPKAFLKMCNLRLLVISDVHLPLGLKYLPDSIKVLAWEGYPLNVLPLGLHNELVDLKMHHSKITKPWDETQFFGKLKAIDLSHSNDLVQTPIVSGIPYLERLILEGCINLVEFHQSVGQHKKLVEVNMENCISLKIFPSKLEMSSLEEIILSGCSQVTKLPDFGENMERLLILNLKDCKNLLCLPNTIGNLKSLETLTISGCSKFSWLPNNIDETEAFEEIDVSGPSVRDLISSNSKGFQLPLKTFFRMSNLSLLKELDISYCNLGGGLVPDDFGCLSSLSRLNLSGNNFVNLPAYCIANLSNLYYLDLNSCPMLQTLPILPQDLYQLFARNCPSMEPLLDPLQLWNLYGLEDHKMISSLRPSCIITGNEIPPWFEHQSYAFHDMRLEQSGIDSIMSISVYIPQYCRSSEWWRIDVCLVLEFVASSSMRGSSPDHLSASIHLNVESTKQGVPSHEDSVYINKQFECPHLWITSLRGLQEHLRGETHQLQLIFFTKTHGGNHYLKIRKCGCHVYCKEDVQLWHRAKGYIENCPSFSSSTSTSTSSRSLIGKSSTSPSTSTSSSSLLGKSSTSTSSNSLIARLVQRTVF